MIIKRTTFSQVVPFLLAFPQRQGELATADELATLRDIQTRYEAIEAQLHGHTFDAHRERIRKAREEYLADPCPKKLEELSTLELDNGALDNQRSILKSTVKQAARAVRLEAEAIISRVFERAVLIAREEYVKADDFDKARCEQFHINHESGPIVGALENMLVQIQERARMGIGTFSPKNALAGILDFMPNATAETAPKAKTKAASAPTAKAATVEPSAADLDRPIADPSKHIDLR